MNCASTHINSKLALPNHTFIKGAFGAMEGNQIWIKWESLIYLNSPFSLTCILSTSQNQGLHVFLTFLPTAFLPNRLCRTGQERGRVILTRWVSMDEIKVLSSLVGGLGKGNENVC